MQNFLFTHTDLDGLGCAVVATMAQRTGREIGKLNIAYVHYNNVNQVMRDFIKKVEDFDEPVRVHITDMCPERDGGKKICAELDSLNTEKKIRLFLCDHHDTSAWVKRYPWAWHDVKKDKCGTKLYLDFLSHTSRPFSRAVDEFAECVCA